MEKILNKEEFEKAIKNDGKVCIKFSAVWCGPCKLLAENIEAIEKEGTDVKFYEIDVEEADQELVEEQKIRNIPVMVLYENGEQKNKVVGLQTIEQIKKLF